MKRSVAIIGTRGYPSFYGGFETAVRHLAPYLSAHDWDVTVYGRSSESHIKPDAKVASAVRSVTTKGIESKSLSTLSYGATAAAHASFRLKPDVALVMNVANGYFLPLLKSRNIPTLLNVDGIEWDRQKWGKAAKTVFKIGAHLSARYATELVFDAEAIGKRWRSEFHRDGVFIPYGGTNPGPLDAPLQLTSGTYVLVVARFVPENTISEFLIAAEEISKTAPVVIVGSSGYGGELDRTAAALSDRNENVRWLGHVRNDKLLFALLQHAGAYFHGHSVGGTNPALVQAMACGAPIIARDTIYNREVLGVDGLYVSPHPTAITGEILALLRSKSLQQRARDNALARSRAIYTWEAVCSSYEAQLRRLADARSI